MYQRESYWMFFFLSSGWDQFLLLFALLNIKSKGGLTYMLLVLFLISLTVPQIFLVGYLRDMMLSIDHYSS
jgi:hypothetical protein